MPLTTSPRPRHYCSSGLPARWSRSQQLLCPRRRRTPVPVSAGGSSAMKFHVICNRDVSHTQSPFRIVEQAAGLEVDWINRFLDREYIRRLAASTLRIYAHQLLHFVRWWESVHHTWAIAAGDLTESTLLEYMRFQSAQLPRSTGSTINHRVAIAGCALRHEFPDSPDQVAP